MQATDSDEMSGSSSIYRLREIAGGLCGGHYEPKNAEDAKRGAELLELAEHFEVALAQAVELAEYVESHAKGKMVEAAQKFLSLDFAEQLRRELVRARLTTEDELSDDLFHDRLYGLRFMLYSDPNNPDSQPVPIIIGMTVADKEGEVAFMQPKDLPA